MNEYQAIVRNHMREFVQDYQYPMDIAHAVRLDRHFVQQYLENLYHQGLVDRQIGTLGWKFKGKANGEYDFS